MIKQIVIRKGGVDYNLSAEKTADGIEIAGAVWTAPMPKELSGHDLNLLKRLVRGTWSTKANGFDLDQWSNVIFADDTQLAKDARTYQAARREHAGLLRMEGLKLQQIGDRLGVNREQARVLLCLFARRMRKATHRLRMYFPGEPSRTKRVARQLELAKFKKEAAAMLGASLLLVALVASCVPARASRSCMSIGEARAAFPDRHLWWHGRQHCWNDSSGRTLTVPVPVPVAMPPRQHQDPPTNILYPALVAGGSVAPEMFTPVSSMRWPLLLDVDELTTDKVSDASGDYCCWPKLEPSFDERWREVVLFNLATLEIAP